VREGGIKGGEGAGNTPYCNVELRRHLLDGGKRRSGGGGLAQLGFCKARRWLRRWRDQGRGTAEGPRRAGPERRAGGGRAVAELGRESEPGSS
jgi:hypothetical protein